MSQQDSKGFYKLSWLQRIGFGAGDLAQNLIYQTICMYLLFFYTDVYVLGGDAAKSAGLAGTMFLVVRIVDVLWDPLVGTFVDKHNPTLAMNIRTEVRMVISLVSRVSDEFNAP